MLQVIPALIDVMADARRERKKSETQVASAYGSRERTVIRWENHENYPWGDDLARAVGAYADVTGVPAATLWRRAIDKAVADEKARGHLEAGEQEAAQLGAARPSNGRRRVKATGRKPRTGPRRKDPRSKR